MRAIAGAMFVIGFLGAMTLNAGWLASLGLAGQAMAATLSALALVLGGTWLGAAWLYDRYRERFPATSRRAAAVTDAFALSLRSLGRDTSALDTAFRFLAPPGQRRVLTESLSDAILAAWRPPFDWIFAGSWRGVAVRVFDYDDPKNPDEGEWTCATFPLDRACIALTLTRRDFLIGGLEHRLDRGFQSGDEVFDRAFHIETNDRGSAQALLDARVRKRLLESAPELRCVIETRPDALLVCGPQVPTGERGPFLERAAAIREALRIRE